jgi:hypothetical protein
MSRRTFILIVVVVGAFAAALATIVLLIIEDDQVGDPSVDQVDPTTTTDGVPEAFKEDQAPLVEAFRADWDRYRRATLWIESSVVRQRTSDGGELNWTQIYAQLPPDRIVAGLGATTGTFDGVLVSCAGEQINTATGCVTGQPAQDYDTVLAEEAAARESYFEPGEPAYLLRRDEKGCFGLRLVRPIATPPYGLEATFCFDDVSGAMTLSVVDRQTTIETTTATEIRTEVSRAEMAGLIGVDPDQ